MGDHGSGHGNYSAAVTFKTPGNREPVSKPASVMSETSSQGGFNSAAEQGRALVGTGSGHKTRRTGSLHAEIEGVPPSYPSSSKSDTVRIRKGAKGGKSTCHVLTKQHTHCKQSIQTLYTPCIATSWTAARFWFTH